MLPNFFQQYCKLSDYAKKYGVTYRTAFNRFNAGKLPGAVKDAAGHICVPIEYLYGPISTDITIYATAISMKDEDSDAMEQQINDMKRFCAARGWRVVKVVKEISSSITEERPRLLGLLADTTCKHIVVANKNTVGRFAFDYINTLLQAQQRQITPIAEAAEDREELIRDYVKVIFEMCKVIGTRRIPKKTIKKFIDSLLLDDPNDVAGEALEKI